MTQGRWRGSFRQTEIGYRDKHTQHKGMQGQVTGYRGASARPTHCVILHGLTRFNVRNGPVQPARRELTTTMSASGGKVVAEERSSDQFVRNSMYFDVLRYRRQSST